MPKALLEKVDITAALQDRPARPANLEVEHRALAELAQEMTERPRNVLQKLVALTLDLCQVGSAGVSLIETQGDQVVFRWEALAGPYAIHRDRTMRRNASPCGVTIDRNSIQLMARPERIFPMRDTPRIHEALLIPFHLRKEPIGTLWVVSHDEQRQFDAEDARVLNVLGGFASAGWLLWKTLTDYDELIRRHHDDLSFAKEVLDSHVAMYKGTVPGSDGDA